MKNKVMLFTSLLVATVLFSSTTHADEPINTGTEFKSKLASMAGVLGPFARVEDFPKSYFLISQNLPFMVGLSLHHPMSQSLALTSDQKEKINEIKGATVPIVVKAAKEIKQLELSLAQQFIDGATPNEMDILVDKISVLRTALTKKHVRCINQVRAVLTDDQFATLQSYAAGRPK